MTTPWVNFGDLIDPAADLDRTALIDAADPAAPREWTFRQLDRAADGVAHALWARGHRRGERVAIAAANSGAYLAALFGIMRAGLVAVPVNFKLPRPTIEFVLGDAGVSLVFADRERRPDCPPDLPVLDLDAAVAEAADRHGDAAPFPTVVPAAGEISLILYTSGSTGRPKGVPLTHDGQLWAVGQRMLSADDPERHRLLVAAPYYHMNGLYVSAMALAARSSVVLLPQFQVRAYLEATARFGCTWITSIPTMLALLVRETELLARIDLSAVERVATGSAPLTQGLIDRIRAVFPRAIFTNGYGTTETGAIAFGPHPRGLPRPDLALGHPIPGVRLRLVRGNDLDADEGVLHLWTPALTPGYLNLPERTAAAMSADGYYVTGDVMRRDGDGFYYFVGRADDMFVCNGENVHPGEVETLLERHPAIQQACVVPVPDEVRGQMPVAFVVPRLGAQLDAQAVKAWALAHGPAYQHPRLVELVAELPRAGTEKIDRAALVARAAALAAGGPP